MPIIAVAAAIGASVVAGTAVAATVGGIAAISAVTALEVVAAVGATVAAVGAVTRDKALTVAGTVLGAVGAIGGLAAGAGLLGDAASSSAPLFGAAPAASTADASASGTIDSIAGGADATSGTAASGDAGLIDTPPAPPGGVGAVDPATDNVITAAPPSGTVPPGTDLAPQDAAALRDSLNASQGAAPDETYTLASTSPPIGQTTTGPPTGTNAVSNPVPNLPPPVTSGGVQTAPVANPSTLAPWTVNPDGTVNTGGSSGSGLGGVVSGLWDKVTNAPALVQYGALQAAGSLLTGLTSTLTPAQVSALNAQAAANNAATALQTQQTANLAMPKAVASSAPVTGAPATLVPGASTQTASPGFINQPVTGKPLTQAA